LRHTFLSLLFPSPPLPLPLDSLSKKMLYIIALCLGALALCAAFPRTCAGGLDGRHTATMEVFLLSDLEDHQAFPFALAAAPTSWALNSAWPITSATANWSMTLPASGRYRGWTSSHPGPGTIHALYSADADMSSPDLSIDESLMGFSMQRDVSATCAAYFLYVWDAQGCCSHRMPRKFSPSLHCVGTSTYWDDASPVPSHFYDGGEALLDFASNQAEGDRPSCSVNKRIAASSGYAVSQHGKSPSGDLEWAVSYLNSSTQPLLEQDFILPSQCASIVAHAQKAC
jgi:hypothetical protein